MRVGMGRTASKGSAALRCGHVCIEKYDQVIEIGVGDALRFSQVGTLGAGSVQELNVRRDACGHLAFVTVIVGEATYFQPTLLRTTRLAASRMFDTGVPLPVDRRSVSSVARESNIALLMPLMHRSPPIKVVVAHNYTAYFEILLLCQSFDLLQHTLLNPNVHGAGDEQPCRQIDLSHLRTDYCLGA